MGGIVGKIDGIVTPEKVMIMIDYDRYKVVISRRQKDAIAKALTEGLDGENKSNTQKKVYRRKI